MYHPDGFTRAEVKRDSDALETIRERLAREENEENEAKRASWNQREAVSGNLARAFC